MRVVIDIETNSLTKPTKIFVIVCKDLDTNLISIFREVTSNEQERQRLLEYFARVTYWVGHNLCGYDLPVLCTLIGIDLPKFDRDVADTLIISKLVNYSRPNGHSIESYGEEFGLEKIKFNSFTEYSKEMEDYCVRDVDICHKIYLRYLPIITAPDWSSSLAMEHSFQSICNDLSSNGFCFNVVQAIRLRKEVEEQLFVLDRDILAAFPPKEVLIREFTPKATKFGTISKTSVPRSLHDSISNYEVGQTYRHTRMEEFNPASHKQLIEVLNAAGWSPEDKTQSHIDTEREIGRLKYAHSDTKEVDLNLLCDKLERLKISGWKINEFNLSTLPQTAPPSARLLAKRILLESRRRTLTEQIALVQDDGRIHGKFYGIGAWTHRMAHQKPNTANIPAEFNNIDGSVKLLGKEMRQLWRAPKNRLLVGVDAEGIQLRVFAHYINDAEFTEALVKGKKDDKTDPHSLNQKILGNVCKTRQAAKRFIYALLLGAGISKLAQVLGCTKHEAEESLARLLQRYTGFAELKREIIPADARRGYFTGLDNRKVPIPGDTVGLRKHLCMSGYLQNGEAIIVKRAALSIDKQLAEDKKLKKWCFVNLVHDELISEIRNSMDYGIKIAKIKADAIRTAGEELNLRCPMAGSYWNDDHKDYTIGTNWYATH